MAEQSGPNKYSRPDAIEAAYSAAQNQRALETAAKEKQKKGKQLSDVLTQIDLLTAQKKAAETTLAGLKTNRLNTIAAALNPAGPGGATITSGEQANIDNATTYVTNQQKTLDAINKNLADAEQKKTNLYAQVTENYNTPAKTKLDEKKKAGNTKKPNSQDQQEAPAPPSSLKGQIPDVYFYNAPMVKTAYLHSEGPQAQTLMSESTYLKALIKNGDKNWTDAFNAKGVIQMNKELAQKYANNLYADKRTSDDTFYGFRFLYNPKEVGMTWGISESVNWEGVAAGLDPVNPLTPALGSTVVFSLLLNRIKDMSWLDKNGLIPGVQDPYPDFATRNGDKQREYALIYKRGTMYDLEYLFRTIMGLNSIYVSKLNGETADKGWLIGSAVELHLGAGMKYLVRLGGLDVTHMIFDERMVPLLSTVNITCMRFNDVMLPE